LAAIYFLDNFTGSPEAAINKMLWVPEKVWWWNFSFNLLWSSENTVYNINHLSLFFFSICSGGMDIEENTSKMFCHTLWPMT
jgi:hypothetical protein